MSFFLMNHGGNMFNAQQMDELTKKLLAILPDNFQSLEEGIYQKFKDTLQATFACMNLVTREEFDIQVKVLARTREKLEHLQKQVHALLTDKDSQ